MGRFKDAWQTLIGRSDVQIRAHAKLVRIEAEWFQICRAIEHTLSDLNTAHEKLRKREERAAKRVKEATPPDPAAVAVPPSLTGREAVIARIKAKRTGGVPTPFQVAQNGNTDEPEA